MHGGGPYRSKAKATGISSLLAAWLLCFCVISSTRAAEGEEPPPVPGAPTYLRFDPIFVSVIEGPQVTRQVGVTIELELTSAQAKPDVEARRNLLSDAFFRELYGFFQTPAGSGGHIDELLLKTRLLAVANRVVGPNLVKEVLIEQLFERRR